jgi:hypothetical protein
MFFIFSSDAKQGIGAMDVYKINLNSDSEAKNLGKPVNSEKDDFAFSFNENKKIGFVASNRNGNDDIFQLLPVCNYEVNTIVINAITGAILAEANVSILDDKNNIISTKKSNIIARNTKDGKNKYLSNHAKTFVLGYKKKVDNAIETYNPKQISKYATLANIDKRTLLNEFSSSYDITKQKAAAVLKETGIDELINQIQILDKLNFNNVLNIV